MNGRAGLVIAAATAFLVGGSLGLMGGILFSRGMIHGPRPLRGGPPGMPGPPIHRLERWLDLSPEQSARVRAITEASRGEMRAVHESLFVRVERELTPEQRAQWRALERRFPGPGERRRPGRAEPGVEGEGRP